jgi:ATP:ADP antiporter, AAA family
MAGWFGIPRRAAGPVAAATLVLFAILAGHSMLETARDALFLSALPASRLPTVYLAIAGLAFAVAGANRRLTRRFSRRGTLGATLVGSAVTTAAFWFWTGGGAAAIYAFYVWTGLLATVVVVQLWLAIADEWDATLAKRAFAVVGAGGLIGATAGSAAAGALLQSLAPHDLILIAAAILLCAGGASAVLLPESAAVPAARPRRRPVVARSDGLWSNPYLRRLLLLVTATQVAVTSADLLFKAVVAESVPAEDLGSFFALFYTGLNTLSLLVQVILASWLLRRLGVSRALWVLPVLLAFGSLGFALTGALVPILVMKVVDGSLRHSLHRTGIELLYLPLPARLRDRHKVSIDGAGARGGQAIAALALLGAMSLGLGLTDLALIVTGAVVLLLVAVVAIKRHYVELFREQLREGSIETRAGVPELDLHSLEALIAALSSDDDRVVLSSLDLLEESGRAKLVPPLILHHPSREVVTRALELFCASGRRDFLPLAHRLLASVDPNLRTAALRAVAVAGGAGEEPTLREALGDPSPSVRATAVIGLISSSRAEGEMSPELTEMLQAPDPESRVALARAIQDRPGARFHPILRALAEVPEPEVQAEVARAVAAAPGASFVPLLLPMLGDRRTRSEARAALVAIGRPALAALDEVLADTSRPRRMRLHTPRTISRFRSQAAADVLSKHLERELDTAIGYKILRGLGRMVVDAPRIQLDPVLLDRSLEAVLRRAITLLDWRLSLEEELGWATTAGGLLVALLREKEEGCAERAFRLLGLRQGTEDFEAIWSGLRSADRKSAASARELLEYLVEPRARAAVLALVDREIEGDAERLSRAAVLFRPDEQSHLDRLRAMMVDPSEALAGLATHHVAELGIRGEAVELGGAVDQVVAAHRGFWTEAIENARRALRAKAEAPGVG